MRKKLLSEAQVRRFQTLATIKPLNETEYNEELYEAEKEAPEMELDAEEAAPIEDEVEADVELDEELVEKFMEAAATIQEVADALGGEAGMEDLEDEMPADDLEAGAEELPAPEADEEEMKLDEALSGINYIPSQKEVVKVVAQRVAKRLQEAKRAQAKLNRALGKRR